MKFLIDQKHNFVALKNGYSKFIEELHISLGYEQVQAENTNKYNAFVYSITVLRLQNILV
jgi:hypothetical protein